MFINHMANIKQIQCGTKEAVAVLGARGPAVNTIGRLFSCVYGAYIKLCLLIGTLTLSGFTLTIKLQDTTTINIFSISFQIEVGK